MTLDTFKRYAASGALNRAATQAVRGAVAQQRAMGLPLDGDFIKKSTHTPTRKTLPRSAKAQAA